MGNEVLGPMNIPRERAPSEGLEALGYYPESMRAKEKKEAKKAKVIDSTKEDIEMEKLYHKLKDAAGKLQIEVSFNNNVEFETQKNRKDIIVERTEDSFNITSYGQKTEIIVEKLDETDKTLALSIKGKAGEVFTIGNKWSSKVNDKITSYKEYSEHDLIVLVGIANLLNSGLFHAKKTKNKMYEPFELNPNRIKNVFSNYITYISSFSDGFKYRTNFLSKDSLDSFFNKHIEGEYIKNRQTKNQDFNNLDLMKKITSYLNLRYMDEVVNKNERELNK